MACCVAVCTAEAEQEVLWKNRDPNAGASAAAWLCKRRACAREKLSDKAMRHQQDENAPALVSEPQTSPQSSQLKPLVFVESHRARTRFLQLRSPPPQAGDSPLSSSPPFTAASVEDADRDARRCVVPGPPAAAAPRRSTLPRGCSMAHGGAWQAQRWQAWRDEPFGRWGLSWRRGGAQPGGVSVSARRRG